MKKSKSLKGKMPAVSKIALGCAVIIGCYAVFSLIFALVLYNGSDPTKNTALFALISLFLSGCIGTFINKRLISDAEDKSHIISALLASLLFIGISAVISGGVSLSCLITALSFALACLAVTVISTGKKRKNRRR